MKAGTKVKFIEHNEVHEGIILGPLCSTAIYVQPTDCENDYPRIVLNKDDIMILEDEAIAAQEEK